MVSLFCCGVEGFSRRMTACGAFLWFSRAFLASGCRGLRVWFKTLGRRGRELGSEGCWGFRDLGLEFF